MKIAVDAMGGDNAPQVVVEGAVLAAREGISVILIGDKVTVDSELDKYETDGLPITVAHASEVVGMAESPVSAIRKKKDSSLRVCFNYVRDGKADAVVSAGNSGAAMAAGMMVLKRLKGVERPAIAVCIPTRKEPVIVLDVGGNVDCKPAHLVQFSLMGDVYAKYVLNERNPRIGLLSNGSEEEKGNELTRATHALMKKTSLNYIGYVEGKDVNMGNVDVVVTDGFLGNVVLKLSEGVLTSVLTMLKSEIESSLISKIGYLFVKKAFKNLKKRIDYAEYGGAPLLGINGICIISHGSSNARAIKNAILRASEAVEHGLNKHLAEELQENSDLSGKSIKQPALPVS